MVVIIWSYYLREQQKGKAGKRILLCFVKEILYVQSFFQNPLNQFRNPSYNPILSKNFLVMQQSNRIKIFTKFADSLRPLLTKQTMAALNQRYYIREFKIWEIDVAIAGNLYFAIVTRNKRPNEKVELGWVENELRLFVWSLVLYAEVNHIDIQDLTEDDSTYDWALFREIFPSKPKELFIYQGKNLLKKHNQYKKWVHEEDQLFEELVKRDNYRLKWSDLGKALFIQSEKKFFRTPKQCRERWLNHLDPSKLKKYWLEEEDFTLIDFVRRNGKKWAAISKKLQNKRNQHSIKNRFKSLLTRQSKQIMRPFDEEALVQSIYQRYIQRGIGNTDKKESTNSEKEEEVSGRVQVGVVRAGEISEDFEQSQDSVSIFQSNQHEVEVRAILNNISLNTVQSHSHSHPSQDHSQKSHPGMAQRQAFQFSKSVPEQLESKEWRRAAENESEMEKRIRADLFLQEDPFEMLKSYFYKGGH